MRADQGIFISLKLLQKFDFRNLARNLHCKSRYQPVEADVTKDKPATARQKALLGILTLLAGLLSLMIVSDMIPASMMGYPAIDGVVERPLS